MIRLRALVPLVLAMVVVCASPAGAKERVYYPNCVGKARYKPTKVVFSCGDGGFFAKRLKWYRWGTKSARGRTRYAYQNDCKPFCANGTLHRYRLRLVLKRVRRCSTGRLVFTRMAVVFGRRRPKGEHNFTMQLSCRQPGTQ